MIRKTLTTLGAAALLMAGLASSGAQASSIGGTVSDADFLAANTSFTGWSFLGSSTAAFTLPGAGNLELVSSTFANTFGFSNTAGGARTEVFSTTTDLPGVSRTISPGFSPFLFYFEANGAAGADGVRRLTDGSATGSAAGESGLDIFFNATINTYSFFFDDGGPPGPGTDRDFNDMVVNFTPASVPEPASLALFGAGLLGLGLIRRRKAA